MEMHTMMNGGRSFIQYAAERLDLTAEEMDALAVGFADMQVLYRGAMRDVRTRLEILDDEFQHRHKRNPIHSIQTRLKSPQSIVEKMNRRGLEPSIEAIRAELTDIAGIRVICGYVDDIYELADLLLVQEGVEMLRCSDYIQRPKPNGYRSLHVVIRVPVYFSDGKQMVPVEIQIRTIAMDFWASLEHELRYKSAAKVTKDIVLELRDCSDSIAEIDARMQRIYQQLEKIENKRRGRFAKEE